MSLALAGCNAETFGINWRLDTNQNEFQMYPVDVKEPISEGEDAPVTDGAGVDVVEDATDVIAN